MKKFIFSLCFSLMSFMLFAQLSLVEDEGVMSAGIKNGFTLKLPSDDAKTNAEIWKKMIKDFKGKTKVNRKTGEIFTDNASIPDMSNNDVDIYAIIKGNQVTAWFDLGGAFLNSSDHESAYPAVEFIMDQFQIGVSKDLAEKDVNAKEKTAKDLEKELKKLEKDNEKYHADIEKAKKAIEEAEQKIEQNLVDQQAKQTEIKAQNKLVEASKENLNSFVKKLKKKIK